MTEARVIRVLAVAVLFAVAGRLPAEQASLRDSPINESEDFHHATETKAFEHSVKDGWRGARLKVKLTLDAGEVIATLVDGTGATRWEKTFRAGKADTEETFDGKPGVWKVHIRLKAATGRYSVSLVNF